MYHQKIFATVEVFCLALTTMLTSTEQHAAKQRVFGGTKVVPFSYPSLISIELQIDDYKLDCQGVLLHPSWILTSCKCLKIHYVDYSVFGARHYRHRLSYNYSEPPNQLRVIDNEKYGFYHPRYNDRTQKNDVALMYVVDPFEINDTVKVAPIATRRFPLPENGTIVGWGMYDDQLDFSMVPLNADLPIASLEECEKIMMTANMSKFVNNRSMCAGQNSPTQLNGCDGNEGAPLYAKAEGKQILLGTMTHAGCSPGYNELTVFAKTWNYIPWIERVTGLCFEEEDYSGTGIFVPYTKNSTDTAGATSELFSYLAYNICKQYADYDATEKVKHPVAEGPVPSIGWGWFRKKNCGNGCLHVAVFNSIQNNVGLQSGKC